MLDAAREQAIRDNIIHQENHQRNLRQLEGLYGRLASAQDQLILSNCAGVNVLDVGAGYGNLTRAARDKGLRCTGIEIDPEKIARAKEWFGVQLDARDIHKSGFEDGRFDTVIFREVVRHLRLKEAFTEAARIARSRVLVFQANPIWVLRVANRIFGHREHVEYGPRDIVAALREAGFECRKIAYNDSFAFPLSGGYIGRQLVPRRPWMYGPILAIDRCLTGLWRALRLGKWMCFRMLIIADKPSGGGYVRE
jgi:SAM-dependent methyltransferase